MFFKEIVKNVKNLVPLSYLSYATPLQPKPKKRTLQGKLAKIWIYTSSLLNHDPEHVWAGVPYDPNWTYGQLQRVHEKYFTS